MDSNKDFESRAEGAEERRERADAEMTGVGGPIRRPKCWMVMLDDLDGFFALRSNQWLASKGRISCTGSL